jgi:hypothetical protein
VSSAVAVGQKKTALHPDMTGMSWAPSPSALEKIQLRFLYPVFFFIESQLVIYGVYLTSSLLKIYIVAMLYSGCFKSLAHT